MVNAQNNVKGYWAPRTRTQKGTGRGAPPTNTESCRSTYCKIFVLPKTFCFWVFLEFNVVWDCFFTVIFVEFYFLGTVFSLSFFLFLTLLWLFLLSFSLRFVAQTFSSLLVVCSFFLTYECFTMFFLWFLMRKPRALFTAESCGFLFLQCSVFFNVIFMLVMLVMFVPLYTPAKHPCTEIMVEYHIYVSSTRRAAATPPSGAPRRPWPRWTSTGAAMTRITSRLIRGSQGRIQDFIVWGAGAPQ